jgi:hypothetical protein
MGRHLLMRLFRERLLAPLLDRHAISQDPVAKLMALSHPGFSAFVGEPLAPQQSARLERVAACLGNSPVSLEKLVYLDGRQAVL